MRGRIVLQLASLTLLASAIGWLTLAPIPIDPKPFVAQGDVGLTGTVAPKR